jgi:hypothetical protein
MTSGGFMKIYHLFQKVLMGTEGRTDTDYMVMMIPSLLTTWKVYY